MDFSGLRKKLFGWFGRSRQEAHSSLAKVRGSQTHVIILDGTMSSLEPGHETNAGLTYRMLQEMGNEVSVFYEAGVQWHNWRSAPDVLMGRGINRQICRAYGFLASRYHPGDRIFLMGYSRGAFAVRSLAGVIDRVGLVTHHQATVRNVRQAYRHYQNSPDSDAAKSFTRLYCHPDVEIEMVGVWDTVKALGVRLPVLWRLSEQTHAFHNHDLGAAVKFGFQALALDETRQVFEPVLWSCPDGWRGHAQQVWFRGTHGDVGGQLGGAEASRPLANIPLVWMLECAEGCGLSLPQDWRERFPMDRDAPSVGTWQSWGKMFLLRRARVVGRDRSERLHETVEKTVAEVVAKVDVEVESHKIGHDKPRQNESKTMSKVRGQPPKFGF